MNGCIVVSAFGSVSWSVGAKWLWWVEVALVGGAFACMSAGFCWLFKCGSVWVVKGVWIWRHKKKARNSARKIAREQCKSALS